MYVCICTWSCIHLFAWEEWQWVCRWRHTHTCTHTHLYNYIYIYMYTLDKYLCGDHKLASHVWNCNVPPRLRKIPREYLYFVRSMVGDPYLFTLGLGPPSCVDAEPRLQRGGPDHLPTAGQWGRGGTSNVVIIINWLITTTGWKP